MARRKAHAPDYSRGLPIARASPERRTLALPARGAPAP